MRISYQLELIIFYISAFEELEQLDLEWRI